MRPRRWPSKCSPACISPHPSERFDDYPHKLSGGMRQRVMIAMALACKPKLLIADEPTTALDVTIQAQILDLMRTLREQTGTAIILITHDLGVVAELADDVAVMYAGRVVERAKVADLFAQPQHPYTIGLLGSIPRLDVEQDRLAAIEGQVPNPLAPVGGCRFHPRCPFVDRAMPQRRAPDRRRRRRAPGCVLARAPGRRCECCRVKSSTATALLRVDNLVKHFPVQQGLFARQSGAVRAVDGVSFELAVGETLALVGESGCGKSTTGRLLLRLLEPTSGTVHFDGVDLFALDAEAMRGATACVADHLPGPLRIAQSAHDRRPDADRAARAAWRRRRTAERASCRTAAAGRSRSATRHALSARIFRRPAPAHRHRPRARRRASADRLRRAGIGARRVDPGPGNQSAGRPAASPRTVVRVHRARPRGGQAHRHPGSGNVSWPHRRIRGQTGAVPRTAPPVHPGVAVGDTDPRSRRTQAAHHPRRRCPQPEPPAIRVPFPDALPIRTAAVRR